MEMESTRRSLDNRSREPGSKKPRLIDELDLGSNPTTRPFPQRQPVVTTLSSAAKFRTNDRDESSGGAYHPQPPPHQELVIQYKTALAELNFNSKPIITNLTIIAGENLSAAKSIAGAVCSNIIEVPSDQKLPSLYLLDSIVKNIGRDYIKYFAVRLPEVFCKAYRQVDPAVHSSMRHLFGTWRGVFPPQTLQTIEKELGLTPAVNGSASASTTLRSDSQSQRPPHSIHVNPKYLERQCLQQSSRTKGGVNDMTGALLNANEDSERPDRPSARPWLDPRVNMHNNQQTHRDAFNDSVPEKSTGRSYGGSEYNSSISSNLGSGVGRAGSRLIGGPAATISGQRNGYGLKHSLSNHEAPKSLNLDAHRQPTQTITNNRSSVMPGNWKNSEEEEFMWDEMNSGLTDHGPNVPSNLSTDPWMDDDENLESEDLLQVTHPMGAQVGREISTVKKQLPAFGGHSSLSWELQKQHSSDKVNLKPGQLERFVSSPSSNINSSAARMGNRSFMPHTTIEMAKITGQQQFESEGVESPSGQSPLRQQSPSVSATVHHPHSMRNLPEHDFPDTLKTSQYLGRLQSQHIRDPSPASRPVVQVGNLRKSLGKDTQGPISSVNSFQPSLQQKKLGPSQAEVSVKSKEPPQSKISLAKGTSEKSNTNSLRATSVKSGIIPNKSITLSLDASNLPSQSGIKPTRSGGPSPTTLISSSSLPKIPQGKVGQPQKDSTQQPTSSKVRSASAPSSNTTNKNTLNPISNLLSSLVAKGLISAETESASIVASEMPEKSEEQNESITASYSLPVVSVPVSAAVPGPSSRDEVYDAGKSTLAQSQSISTEIINLIGFDFKPDVIREMHPHVIRGLLDELPHHCKTCGTRLKHQEQLDRHLEWHATREREENDMAGASRKWYPKSNEWIAGKEEHLSESEFTDSVDVYDKETDGSQLDTMVVADENQCLCVLCGELFEDVYCQETDQWMFKGAVYLNNSDNNSEMESRNVGPIIHARCLSENSISSVANTEQD